jgi:hypothetical protein
MGVIFTARLAFAILGEPSLFCIIQTQDHVIISFILFMCCHFTFSQLWGKYTYFWCVRVQHPTERICRLFKLLISSSNSVFFRIYVSILFKQFFKLIFGPYISKLFTRISQPAPCGDPISLLKQFI